MGELGFCVCACGGGGWGRGEGRADIMRRGRGCYGESTELC